MKRHLFLLLWIPTLFLQAVESDFTAKFEKKSVYGSWINIDTAAKVNLTSKESFSFERLDNEIIILKMKGVQSYMRRIGVAKTAISGRVMLSSGKKNTLPAKNTTLYLTHIADSTLRAKIRTDAQGYFSDESLPSGEYTLSCAKKGHTLKARIRLEHKTEALGTFVLKPEQSTNFRSTLKLEGSYLIANETLFKGSVTITNFGDKRGDVCYSASLDDPKLKELAFTGSCQSISAKQSLSLPIALSFSNIDKSKTLAVLNIHLTEGSGAASIEAHPLTVYQNAFKLKLQTPLKSLKAYVELPNKELKELYATPNGFILPRINTLDYQLIIANTDPRTTTEYHVDVGAQEVLTHNSLAKPADDAVTEDKTKTFRLKQSIGRYPNLGDVAVYAFTVPETIEMQEDGPQVRIPFSQRNDLGDPIEYLLTLSDERLATASYTDGTLTITPKKDAFGLATITLKNKNGTTFGDKNIKRFTLLVHSVNDKPRITSKPFRSILEGDPYRYTLEGSDLESRQLRMEAVKLPKWLKFSEKKGLLYGKPSSKDIGLHNITLALKDDQDSTLQSFTLRVTPKRDADNPIFTTFKTQEDTAFHEHIKTAPVENAVTLFSLAKTPANGKLLLKPNGDFSYTPSQNFNGSDSFSVNYSVDGKNKVLLIAVDVESVNDAPTVKDIILPHVGIAAQTINWEKASKAVDIDEDDLFLEIKSRTALGTLVQDQEILRYTPYPNKQGSEKVLLKVTDKQGGSALFWLYLYNVERGITPKVLQTGQTIIFRDNDDGVYKNSIPREYETDLKDRVVKDLITLKTWYADPSKELRDFKQTQEFCEDLKVEDVRKWRVPTIEELVMITDKGRVSPAIDPIFKAIQNRYYWSSTSYKKRPDHRWVLYFDYGEDYYRHESQKLPSLCIHDGIDDLHPPREVNLNDSDRTYILSTETNATDTTYNEANQAFVRNKKLSVVTDKRAELMWYDGTIASPTPWISALTHCESLDFAGFSNWRVPNFNELYLITNHDPTRSSTHAAFENAPVGSFWSSTSSEEDHDRAWGISFSKGSDFTYDKAEQLFTRCVRDLK